MCIKIPLQYSPALLPLVITISDNDRQLWVTAYIDSLVNLPQKEGSSIYLLFYFIFDRGGYGRNEIILNAFRHMADVSKCSASKASCRAITWASSLYFSLRRVLPLTIHPGRCLSHAHIMLWCHSDIDACNLFVACSSLQTHTGPRQAVGRRPCSQATWN